MYDICIIGAFDFKHLSTGGQPVKTRQFHQALVKIYKNKKILCIDTQNWKKELIKIIFKLLIMSLFCKDIYMLPAKNGLIFISKLLHLQKKCLNKHIYYNVIGGWLPCLTQDNIALRNILLNFDKILVETQTMKYLLDCQGFNNIYILMNYKNLEIIDLNFEYVGNNKLCTFSRVIKNKGIEDAIKSVCNINKSYCKEIYRLDIYGEISRDYLEDFTKIIDNCPQYIRYCGVADSMKSVEVLSNYFLLLFPTKYYTEGIPGTIIDAYAAGVPIVSSKWESYSDILIENKTSLCYEFNDDKGLEECLLFAMNNVEKIGEMKKYCLEESKKYTEESFINKFKEIFNLEKSFKKGDNNR